MGRIKDYFIDDINKGLTGLKVDDQYNEWLYRKSHFPVMLMDPDDNLQKTTIDLNKHPDIIYQFDIDDDHALYVSCTNDIDFIADKKIELYTTVKQSQ